VDAALFFDTILPDAGLRCLAVPRPDKKFNHRFGPNNAWLAQATQHLDATAQINVYFACASYIMPDRRKQSNVDKVRAFWADLDVGESKPGKPPKYATQREAAAAILAFCTEIGLPLPLLVNSGWGVHAYWPTTADMEPRVWKTIAQALKRALTAKGVLFDPTRTADEVLRPPGTFNRKATPKPVRVVRWAAQVDLALIVQPLLPWAAAAGPDPFDKLGPAPAGVGKGSSDLTAGVGFDPSSALMIADNCAIMAKMRDTRGNIDQPTWYGALGVLAQTIEAPAIAHEWSKGHPNYSKAETDTKLAQAGQYPPTTCDKLGEQWSNVCKACPHFGQIKSPIVLGRPRIAPVSVTPEIKSAGFAKAAPLVLPYGFGVQTDAHGRRLTYTKKVEKEGVVSMETEVICDTFFMGVTRLWSDGAGHIEFVADKREGPHDFTMSNSTIGKGGREVIGELAGQEIIARPGKDRHVEGYLKGWISHMKDTAEQVLAYQSFGWAGEKFVLGDAVLAPGGQESRAVMVNSAKQMQANVGCSGDLDTWVKLVDRAYNAPGQEAFQFQIACAFAAPLLSLMQQVKGVTVYAYSAGSGIGKTTVQKVGLSAWGNWNKLMMVKVTANALLGLMGVYNSLPVVYDELTNAENAEISDLVFSVSSGRAKERMTASGDMRTNNANWSTIMLASGNTQLSEKLSLHRSNAEAEISRLFEFTLVATPHLGVAEANALFPQFDTNYGHAGRAFARYVTDNRASVEDALRRMQLRIVQNLHMKQVERHWSALFAAVLVALTICRQLGLLKFEVGGVYTWITQQLGSNRDQKMAMVASDEDQIGYMIADLWEGVLVTTGEGDLRGRVHARVEKHPRAKLIGRSINPLLPGDAAQLFISRAAVRAWAASKGVSAGNMFKAAVDLGWCDPKADTRYSFGKGTVEYNTGTLTVPCWKFYPKVMDGMVGQVVQQLTAMKGGKP
jgi:hypothetical protein